MKKTLLLTLCLLGSILLANAQNQQEILHTVKTGDTFYKIAQFYNIPMDFLKHKNPGININRIAIGDKIILPTRTEVEAWQSGNYTTIPNANPNQAQNPPPNTSDEVPDIKPEYTIMNDKIVYPAPEAETGPTFFDKVKDKNSEEYKRLNSYEGTVRRYEVPEDMRKKHQEQKLKELEARRKIEKQEAQQNQNQTGIPDSGIEEPIGQAVIPATINSPNEPQAKKPIQYKKQPLKQDPATGSLQGLERHTVMTGETLYSISKVYSISVAKLLELNPEIKDNNIREGQQLIVPSSAAQDRSDAGSVLPDAWGNDDTYATTDKTIDVEWDKVKPLSTDGPQPIYHKITQKETLYRISRDYQQSIDQLMDWNNLEAMEVNDLKIGKQIIVGWYEENKVAESIDHSSPDMIADRHKMGVFHSEYLRRSTEPMRYELIRETGKVSYLKSMFAEEKEYFYGLHRTAPKSSILKVVNPMNGRSIYVKVLGELPDTGENLGLQMKITAAGHQELRLIDDVFRLKWSYHLFIP